MKISEIRNLERPRRGAFFDEIIMNFGISTSVTVCFLKKSSLSWFSATISEVVVLLNALFFEHCCVLFFIHRTPSPLYSGGNVYAKKRTRFMYCCWLVYFKADNL